MRVPLKEGLLSSIDPEGDAHLIGGRCADCRQLHFPASDGCPYCSGERVSTVPLSNRGTLYLHTAVERPPPGYGGRTPYGLGVVELPEGIRIITRLTEGRPERLMDGAPMCLVLEDLSVDESGRTVVGWAFAPEILK
jgi:uncharacterized protein